MKEKFKEVEWSLYKKEKNSTTIRMKNKNIKKDHRVKSKIHTIDYRESEKWLTK